jgi:hypothetical protein
MPPNPPRRVIFASAIPHPLGKIAEDKIMVSLLTKLHAAQAERAAPNGDPWALPLGRVRGQIGDDGIERVTTQHLFDLLQVEQRSRGAGACRRLAKVMTELGWMAVRVRGLTRGAYLEQVRGYARDARHEQVCT